MKKIVLLRKVKYNPIKLQINKYRGKYFSVFHTYIHSIPTYRNRK